MSRQDANAAFALTSFLYGGNAAYIEDLYARYEADPASVDAQWQSFFQSLKDDPASVASNAKGASWKKPGWPPVGNGELVAALDGNWAETEKLLGDKIKGRAQKSGI
jgi:2-oxoglutarate dehydrogenase E1 component